MSRRGGRRALAALGLALGLAASGVPSGGGARAAGNAEGDCRQVDVRTGGGSVLTGIEDAVFDGPEAGGRHGRLILSAHDRRASGPAGAGGLYTLDAAGLSAAQAVARRLEVTGGEGMDWYPHGIALWSGAGGGAARLAVINRIPAAADGGPGAELLVIDLGAAGARLRSRVASPLLCRANDAAFVNADTVLVTLDQAGCRNWDLWIERALAGPRGSVVRVDLKGDAPPRRVAAGIAYANGIAVDRARGVVHVAATRGRAVLTYALDDLTRTASGAKLPWPAPLRRTALAGGPDNLALDARGGVIAAVHPDLFSLFLSMQGLAPVPGSEIVRIGADGKVARLAAAASSGTGTIPGAATAAVPLDGTGLMAVVSAWDAGLGLCRIAAAPDGAAQGGAR